MKTKIIFIFYSLSALSLHAQFVTDFDSSFKVLSQRVCNCSIQSYKDFPCQLLKDINLDCNIDNKVELNENNETAHISYRIPVDPKHLSGDALEFLSIYSEESDPKSAFCFISQTGVQFVEVKVKNLEILFDSKGLYVISVRKTK